MVNNFLVDELWARGNNKFPRGHTFLGKFQYQVKSLEWTGYIERKESTLMYLLMN